MADSKATEAAEATADVARKAARGARSAGAETARVIEDAADEGVSAVRDSARSTSSTRAPALRRSTSLSDAIRENPLAAAGAALFTGLVLGRLLR
ncbi:hypothetical protein ACFSCV_03000 [Methylopila henanensis]|uniref:DUF883 domain-containing protein n=1 Tax=Methylopila henanensis TaxID=873516 RepID=A0ABW4K3Z8_9HYPH